MLCLWWESLSGDATDSMIGAANLSKSTLGVVGFLLILSIGLVPLIKSFLVVITFEVGSAIANPFVNQRMMKSFEVICDSAKMILGVLSMFIMLYLIQIAFLIKMKG